jgi:hypothetical protein
MVLRLFIIKKAVILFSLLTKAHTILNPDVSGDFRKKVKKLVW